MLELVNECKKDGFNCAQTVISSLIALACMAFSIYCLFKIYKTLNKFPFEVIPLSTTLLQAIMQFTLVFIYSDLKFLITALYFQAMTFGFVTFSFVQLYFRSTIGQKNHRYWKIIQYASLAILSTLIILIILTLTNVLDIVCNDFYSAAYYLPISFLILTIVVALIFGIKLRNHIKTLQKTSSKIPDLMAIQEDTEQSPYTSDPLSQQDHNYINNNNSDPLKETMLSELEKQNQYLENFQETLLQDNDIIEDPVMSESVNNEDSQFFKIQIKSIKFTMITFAVTGFLQLFFDFIREIAFSNNLFQCLDGQTNKIFDPINPGGSIYLMFYQLVYLVPCTIVPYAFYYLPFFKHQHKPSVQGAQDIKFGSNSFAAQTYKQQNSSNKYNSSFHSDLGDYNQDSNNKKITEIENYEKRQQSHKIQRKPSDNMGSFVLEDEDDDIHEKRKYSRKNKDTFVQMQQQQEVKFDEQHLMQVQANMSAIRDS